MANPNKTVGNFRRKHGYGHSSETLAKMNEASNARWEKSWRTNWMCWGMEKASKGVTFANEAEVQAAFDARPAEERV